MRLPLLFQHFVEHKQKSGDLSFMDFLIMHYKSNVAHDDQDNSLPFKDPAHACVYSAMNVCAPEIVMMENFFPMEVHHSSIYKEAFLLSPLSEIFQPPRLA
jgi:hypothetical protein